LPGAMVNVGVVRIDVVPTVPPDVSMYLKHQNNLE
jgi:hypothetical protein